MITIAAIRLLTIAFAAVAGVAAVDIAGEQRTLRAGDSGRQHAPAVRGHLIVQEPEPPEQRLRVCNAFMRSGGLELTLLRTGWRLGTLEYKQCRDFGVELRDGDQVGFRSGSLDLGTFAISELPKSAAGLLLIVHKRSPHSIGAAFKSHAFVEEGAGMAQLAVIDTFEGGVGDKVHILSAVATNASAPPPAAEELPLDTVVAINPGSYKVTLGGEGAAVPASNATLTALAQTSYVVLRVGQSQSQDGYREEVVVFPQISGAVGRSAAVSVLGLLASLFAIA